MEMAHNQLASSGFPPADVVQEGPLSVSLCVADILAGVQTIDCYFNINPVSTCA